MSLLQCMNHFKADKYLEQKLEENLPRDRKKKDIPRSILRIPVSVCLNILHSMKYLNPSVQVIMTCLLSAYRWKRLRRIWIAPGLWGRRRPKSSQSSLMHSDRNTNNRSVRVRSFFVCLSASCSCSCFHDVTLEKDHHHADIFLLLPVRTCLSGVCRGVWHPRGSILLFFSICSGWLMSDDKRHA